jgi:hypothetical protein
MSDILQPHSPPGWPLRLAGHQSSRLVRVVIADALIATFAILRRLRDTRLLRFGLLVGALLVTSLRPFAWVTIFAEAGTIVVILAVPAVVREAWRTCRLNLLGEYVGQNGRTTIRLRLFRRGVFTIHWQIERLAGEYGVISKGRIGNW